MLKTLGFSRLWSLANGDVLANHVTPVLPLVFVVAEVFLPRLAILCWPAARTGMLGLDIAGGAGGSGFTHSTRLQNQPHLDKCCLMWHFGPQYSVCPQWITKFPEHLHKLWLQVFPRVSIFGRLDIQWRILCFGVMSHTLICQYLKWFSAVWWWFWL